MKHLFGFANQARIDAGEGLGAERRRSPPGDR